MKVASEDEVSGVVSIVMDLQRAPEVVVMIGEDWDSSMGDRPLQVISGAITWNIDQHTDTAPRPGC